MTKYKKPPLVTIIAYNQLAMFEFGIATEAFNLERPEFEHWYDCQIIAVEPTPLKARGNITIDAEYNFEKIKKSDIIIIPGWSGMDKPVPQDFKDALLIAYKNGARIATICSGVFVLAKLDEEMGILNGKKVTTHWKNAITLQSKFPNLNIDPDILYIDEGQILTSAGSAAGLDLCLHIIRQDFGAKIANQVAQRLVLPAHREGGQKQYIPQPLTPKDQSGDIAELLDKVRMELENDWPVAQMANHAVMSERSFLRKFKQVTGETPKAWLVKERLFKVKEMLEASDASVSQIAEATGFVTPETLRHHFRRLLGTSPLHYRSQFKEFR
ncbi:MAG: transcriptional regulator FtrA [Hyphomicrobiales bacterium]